LLLFIADKFDIDTARAIAHNVAKEQALDPGVVELLESL
jgi:hypothetical protein